MKMLAESISAVTNCYALAVNCYNSDFLVMGLLHKNLSDMQAELIDEDLYLYEDHE